jgi:hypothetical protein
MADPSYMDQVLGWLRGGDSTPTPTTVNLAPPLASYPSSDDADFARQSGFSQGSPNAAFLDNSTARVLGHELPIKRFDPNYVKALHTNPNAKPGFSNDTMFLPDIGIGKSLKSISEAADNPAMSGQADLTKQGNLGIAESLHNVTMRAALAANRIPVAAVGFDPNRVAFDVLAGDKGNVAGAYSPIKDSIYANADPKDPSTVVHESIHRGMEKLRQNYPDQMTGIQNHLPDEEMVVRYLMQSGAGNPESASTGNISIAQQRNAANLFDTSQYPNMAGVHQKALDQMKELAIQAMKDRGKRAGPQ